MKKKLVGILLFFSLVAVGAALWQAYQAAHLEDELRAIDYRTQAARLVELSLPRVRAEMETLLSAEQRKLGKTPPIGKVNIPMPPGGKADFNGGFFLLSPAMLQTPVGDEDFAQRLAAAPAITNTIRRKAYNPSAPLYDPNEKQHYDPRTQLPVFGVYEVQETDLDKPMRLVGEPGPFFAWNYGDTLVCMRSVPTTHGAAAEGFVINVARLAAHLLPLVEPGLREPSIDFVRRGEAANLAPLPLVLRPGEKVELPDTSARKAALRGPVISAWLISILSIIIVFIMLVGYARLERRRSDFVSAVTHELRTPLTSFQLYTEMLQQPDLPADKMKEYHETLHRESLRLGHLVENVLSYARLSRGKMRERQDVGSCSELLSALLEKTADHLRRAGWSVTITIDPRVSLLRLRTDLISVEQILQNLVDNAVKYASSDHAHMTLHALQTHRTLSLRVADNGPGIPPEMQKQLFRPFSRTQKAEDSRKPGIGLGLALSRDLARSIGGELTLERSSAQGATFLLTLPLGE